MDGCAGFDTVGFNGFVNGLGNGLGGVIAWFKAVEWSGLIRQNGQI